MHTARTLEALDALIATRSILHHPFYQAWSRGELTPEQLRTYAELYFPHVRAFPQYLEIAIAGTDDDEVRKVLEDNLREELLEPAPHAELWARFAEGLGASRAELETGSIRTEIAEAIDTFRTLCATSTPDALTALYAYESQQPEVAATKSEGLREHYGLSDPEALAYFDVHVEADRRHRADERRALERTLAQGEGSEATVLAAAGGALDAYWKLLDGVCEATGIDPS